MQKNGKKSAVTEAIISHSTAKLCIILLPVVKEFVVPFCCEVVLLLELSIVVFEFPVAFPFVSVEAFDVLLLTVVLFPMDAVKEELPFWPSLVMIEVVLVVVVSGQTVSLRKLSNISSLIVSGYWLGIVKSTSKAGTENWNNIRLLSSDRPELPPVPVIR